MADNAKVDAWIEQLMQCKHISETEVQELCVKVQKNSFATPRLLTVLNVKAKNCVLNTFPLTPALVGSRNLDQRAKCSTREMPSHRVW